MGGDAQVHYHELPRHSTKWRGRLTRKDDIRVGVRCGIVETCRNGLAVSLRLSEVKFAEAVSLTPGRMATVSLKNVMKIYPHSADEKKKKKKKGDAPEKKTNLQITERGVVAVQQFNLDIADQEFIVLVGPSGCG